MSKYLVIVESPAKAKTIKKYLGSDYKIAASMGHIRFTPKPSWCRYKNDFDPMYIIIAGKSTLIKELKADAERPKILLQLTLIVKVRQFLASFTYIKIDPETDCRITFNEITKNAVVNAVKQPRPIDMRSG